LLSFAFGPSAPIKTGYERGNNVHQIFFSRLSRIDHHQFPALDSEQRLYRGNPETASTIFVLHHNMAHRGISKRRQKPGTLIVDPAATFFDDLMNRPSLDSTPHEQPFSLGLQMLCVLPVGNAGIDGHFSGNW